MTVTVVREQARLLLDRLRLLGDGAVEADRADAGCWILDVFRSVKNATQN